VRSRYVAAAGGVLLIILGLFPKLSYVVASVPQYVLGGAGIVMFGMVAAAGIRMLGMVDFQQQRHNLLIIAVSVGFGMMPTLAPQFFHHFPDWTRPITHSGIVMGTLVAVLLNAWFNGIRGTQELMQGAAAAAH
jgi:NCS2 family nucleobase:cation symporter-2